MLELVFDLMEADPWRNPFADEDSARQGLTSQSTRTTTTSLAWTPSISSSETFTESAVTAPASTLDASLAWDPSSDVADSVWTWESTAKPTPASPKWEPVAFESTTWSPSNDASPSGRDAGFHEAIPEPTVAVLSLPTAEPSSLWTGDDVPPSPAVNAHPRTPSTPVLQDPAVAPSARSPDEFGSFEAGETRSQASADNVDIPWSGSAGAIHYHEADPTWGSTAPTVEESTPAEPDEWQSATEAREQRDLVAVGRLPRAFRLRRSLTAYKSHPMWLTAGTGRCSPCWTVCGSHHRPMIV